MMKFLEKFKKNYYMSYNSLRFLLLYLLYVAFMVAMCKYNDFDLNTCAMIIVGNIAFNFINPMHDIIIDDIKKDL